MSGTFHVQKSSRNVVFLNLNDNYSRDYLDQIVTLEKNLYGESAFGSIDAFSQFVDPVMASPGVMEVALDVDQSLVVGYALALKADGDICFAANLVLPEYRGIGIGSELKSRLIRETSKYGNMGWCTVAPDNVVNIALNLNKCGWEISRWVPLKYGENPMTDNRFYLEGQVNSNFDMKRARSTFDPRDYPLHQFPLLGASNVLPKITTNSFVVELDDPSRDYSCIDWQLYRGVALQSITNGPKKSSFVLFEVKK